MLNIDCVMADVTMMPTRETPKTQTAEVNSSVIHITYNKTEAQKERESKMNKLGRVAGILLWPRRVIVFKRVQVGA